MHYRYSDKFRPFVSGTAALNHLGVGFLLCKFDHKNLMSKYTKNELGAQLDPIGLFPTPV